MKLFLKRSISLISLLSISIFSIAQSSSVFDANYFDKDNTAPPIKIGKGFHINDVYKQTKPCFTIASSGPDKLTPQQTGGKKTSIRLYYTRTNQEYNSFRTKGISGKVSFLNLFAANGQKLDEYSNKNITDEERIIFSANVDFGVYSFNVEPQLTPEAKALIEQKKLNDFVKYYGTHYISGIRKESSVNVILTKSGSKTSSTENHDASLKVGGKIPFRATGSVEIDNGNWLNTQLDEFNFSLSIEVNGPGIEQSALQNEINYILNNNDPNKGSAIAGIIQSAISNISDPNRSMISQYYYTPFELLGLEGINWDDKKQNQLIKINEAVVKVYSAKTLLNEITSESGKNELKERLGTLALPENYANKIFNKYNELLPKLIALSNKAYEYLNELEIKYNMCANVYCPKDSPCCNNEVLLSEIANYNFDKKIEAEMDKIKAVAEDIAKEISTPECEKQKKGIITIQNYSSNPYSLYQGDKFIEVIYGKVVKSYNVNPGTYYFKAVQNSGYLMYPTVNMRTAYVTKVCEEVILNIGFED